MSPRVAAGLQRWKKGAIVAQVPQCSVQSVFRARAMLLNFQKKTDYMKNDALQKIIGNLHNLRVSSAHLATGSICI